MSRPDLHARLVEALLDAGVEPTKLNEAHATARAHIFEHADGTVAFTDTPKSIGSLVGKSSSYVTDPVEFVEGHMRRVFPALFPAPVREQETQIIGREGNLPPLGSINLTAAILAARATEIPAPKPVLPSAEEIGAALDRRRRQPWFYR